MRSNSLSFGRVALLGEPLVEHQVVLLRLAGKLAPDDERPAAVGVVPVTVRNQYGPSSSCLRRPFSRRRFWLSRLNAVLKICGAAMCRTVRPISQLKVSSRSTLTSQALVRSGPLDLQLVGRGVGKGLHVEQRLAAACLNIEHVAQDVLLS